MIYKIFITVLTKMFGVLTHNLRSLYDRWLQKNLPYGS